MANDFKCDAKQTKFITKHASPPSDNQATPICNTQLDLFSDESTSNNANTNTDNSVDITKLSQPRDTQSVSEKTGDLDNVSSLSYMQTDQLDPEPTGQKRSLTRTKKKRTSQKSAF